MSPESSFIMTAPPRFSYLYTSLAPYAPPLFPSTMADNLEKNKEPETYFQDAESTSPHDVPGPLHRQLKNRHIAMIRSVRRPSSHPIHSDLPQYRWCHWNRSLPWDRQLTRSRWSSGSPTRLHHNGVHCLCRHGTPHTSVCIFPGF